MKLLMLFAKHMAFTPTIKNLPSVPESSESVEYNDVLVAFIHAEEQDEKAPKETETKLVKNLKWAAKKNNTNKIILHSFAHLSSSKSSPEFAQEIIDKTQQRLNTGEYEVFQTPFGYFLDLNLDLPGYSQARIFTEFNRINCNESKEE